MASHSGGIRLAEATKFEYGNNGIQVLGNSSYLKNLYLL